MIKSGKQTTVLFAISRVTRELVILDKDDVEVGVHRALGWICFSSCTLTYIDSLYWAPPDQFLEVFSYYNSRIEDPSDGRNHTTELRG